ncbi:MAG: class I SAM-dependent methyltransferase [Phycisphaerales bacterium]
MSETTHSGQGYGASRRGGRVDERIVLDRIDAAIARRAPLLRDPDTNCCRVFNGPGDGITGIDIDRYHTFATLITHEGSPAIQSLDLRAIARHALRRLEPFGVRAIYHKPHTRDRAGHAAEPPKVLTDPSPIAGSPQPARLLVREHGVSFEVHPYDGYSTGLFLDQRENRAHLAGIVSANEDVSLLNLFAYTGGFSVATALAGATTTTVDVSANYLAWAKRNFQHNAIDPEHHHFARMDALEFVRHAAKKRWRYDAIVIDPPSFGARDKRRGIPAFSIERDLPVVIAECDRLLTDGGLMLISTNNRTLCEGDALDRLIDRALGRPAPRLDHPGQPIDFPGNEARFTSRLIVAPTNAPHAH